MNSWYNLGGRFLTRSSKQRLLPIRSTCLLVPHLLLYTVPTISIPLLPWYLLLGAKEFDTGKSPSSFTCALSRILVVQLYVIKNWAIKEKSVKPLQRLFANLLKKPASKETKQYTKATQIIPASQSFFRIIPA